jgi:hypothetical protein
MAMPNDSKKLKELKELRIKKLIAENRPIVKAKGVRPLSLSEINKIKHLSRTARS